jgi:hypothetical protein
MTTNVPGAFSGGKAMLKKSMDAMRAAFADKPMAEKADGKKEKTCPKCGKPMHKGTCSKGK